MVDRDLLVRALDALENSKIERDVGLFDYSSWSKSKPHCVRHFSLRKTRNSDEVFSSTSREEAEAFYDNYILLQKADFIINYIEKEANQ